MIELAYGGLVGLRAKPVLIVLVVIGILYVFISPLPEMAATSSGRCLAFLVPFLLLFLLAMLDAFLPFASGQQLVTDHSLSRSLLCTRLC